MLKDDISHDWFLIPTVPLLGAVNGAEVCVTGSQQSAGGLDGSSSVSAVVPAGTELPTATSQCWFKGRINVRAFPLLGSCSLLQPVGVYGDPQEL